MRANLTLLGIVLSICLHSTVWADSGRFTFKSCERYDSALQFMRETSTICANQRERQSCEDAAKRQFKVCGFSTNLSNVKKNRLKELLMLVLISGSHTSTKLALRK